AIDGALQEALGKPAAACAKTRGTPHTVERRWAAPGLQVHLTFFDFTGQAMTYDPNTYTFNPLVPSTQYEAFKPRSFPRRIVLRYFPTANKELEGAPPCN
ncbi:MAG: hypothetical protein IT563_11420, partial [Alphaproteobacteria bacterium]|nr:hypothetical protein [Alphaproteobacteria bacterium]